MQHYYIEGLFITKQGLKRSRKSGKVSESDIEPFNRLFYADSPEEAIEQATEYLKGGQWVNEPKVSKTSEEERMRRMGAPQLPGFSKLGKKPKK
jgi:hypothetical protein